MTEGESQNHAFDHNEGVLKQIVMFFVADLKEK